MVTIKPVSDSSPDPKIGKPKPKSGVACPYYDLDQSIVVAKTIHEQGGGACSREQLAPLLKYSGTNNGGFLTRVSAAKMFGLIEESAETLRITPRAQNILSPVMPQEAERAKTEAFLAVDFFNNLYERFKGQSLPQEAGLKNLLQNTYQIVPGRVVPSLRVLLDSAEQAGFFKAVGNRSRMVMPLSSNGGGTPTVEQAPKVDPGADSKGHQHERKQDRRSGNDGGSGGGGAEIPAALLGLLKELPAVGTPILPKRRAALTDAFKSAINFLYPEPEDGDAPS